LPVSWTGDGYGLIDCQMNTPHLASLGAREVPRARNSSPDCSALVCHPAAAQPGLAERWRADRLVLGTEHAMSRINESQAAVLAAAVLQHGNVHRAAILTGDRRSISEVATPSLT
jgi:hypothetical protein